ncbi:aminotransferase class IV [Cryomorphaceae bacterium]|nr:aminotransferase class IV [Cryomorphaceae bacterium]
MINFNGGLRPDEAVQLSTTNRGFRYADGVFETIRVVQGKIHFWEDHYFRLMSDMRILRMEIPLSWSPEYLEEQIHETLKANALDNGAARVRFSVYRAGGGTYTPETREVEYIIEAWPLLDEEFIVPQAGKNIQLFQDHAKPSGLLSNLKSSNAQVYTLAGIFAQENGFDDALLINEHKHLVEGISSNVWLVFGKTVKTPGLDQGCVKGVVRTNLLKWLPKWGYEVEETKITPFELQRADEVWLTNTIKGLEWVGQYRKKTYSNTEASGVVRRMNMALT